MIDGESLADDAFVQELATTIRVKEAKIEALSLKLGAAVNDVRIKQRIC
jgi:hypothetical protein